MNKKKLVMGFFLICFVIVGVYFTQQKAKEMVADAEARWELSGYNDGMSDGRQLCSLEIENVFESIIPAENCVTILFDRNTKGKLCDADKAAFAGFLEKQKVI